MVTPLIFKAAPGMPGSHWLKEGFILRQLHSCVSKIPTKNDAFVKLVASETSLNCVTGITGRTPKLQDTREGKMPPSPGQIVSLPSGENATLN